MVSVIELVSRMAVLIAGRPQAPMAWVVVPSGVFTSGHMAWKLGHSSSWVMALLPAPPSQGTISQRV